MRSAFSTLVNSIITVVVVFFIISQFKQPEPITSEIEFSNAAREFWSKRLQNLVFSVPIENISDYDYTFPGDGLEPEEPEEFGTRSISYPPVNSRFLAKNQLYHGSLSVASSRLLDESLNFYVEDVSQIREYYYSYVLPVSEKPHRFRFTHLDLLNFQQASPFQKQSISYTYREDLVVNALITQFKLAHLLLKDTGSDFQTVAIIPGAIPENLQNRGAAGRRQSIEQVARNIIDAVRQLRIDYPEAKIRVLVENTYPADNRFEPGQLICVELAECLSLKDEIIRQNRFAGNPIAEPDSQVGLIINTAALFASWQDKASSSYKNNANTPLALFQLINKLKEELKGNDQSIQALKVSYAQQGENPPLESFNLNRPFSRALRSQDAFLQLRLATFFFNEAMLGDRGQENFLSADFTPARRFSLIHEFFFPVADSLNLYYDKEGAGAWEQAYSLDLIKHFLIKNTL